MKIRRTLKIVSALLVVGAIGIQLVPVERTNPPVTMEVPAPAPVMAVLKQSCYDCHSNQTRWPWYSYVAPVSWLVTSDVHEGREHLNFSTWDRYEPPEQAELVEEAHEEAAHGAMPLRKYTVLHPGAALTPEDLATLRDWAASAGEGQELEGRTAP